MGQDLLSTGDVMREKYSYFFQQGGNRRVTQPGLWISVTGEGTEYQWVFSEASEKPW